MYRKQLTLQTSELFIDLEFRGRRTIIQGDSGTGKSYVFDLLNFESKDENIIFINLELVYNIGNFNLIYNALKNIKNSLIFIDNANDIFELYPKFEDLVDEDYNNQYVIIGRAPQIQYNISNMAELKISDGKARLEYLFPEPL